MLAGPYSSFQIFPVTETGRVPVARYKLVCLGRVQHRPPLDPLLPGQCRSWWHTPTPYMMPVKTLDNVVVANWRHNIAGQLATMNRNTRAAWLERPGSR